MSTVLVSPVAVVDVTTTNPDVVEETPTVGVAVMTSVA